MNHSARIDNNVKLVREILMRPETTFTEAVEYFTHWVWYEISYLRLRKAQRRFKNAADKMNDLDDVHEVR